MASGTRMCWIQLLLKKFFAVSILISLTDGSPLEVMSAPSLLQAGTAENIFVEIQDYELENDIPVQISVVNYPTKRKHLAITSLILSKISNYQGFGRIKIPAEDFSKDPDIKQYVYLQARFPDRVLEKVVLVYLHSGSIFIQTDNNIYTQESEVLYRIFAVTPGMEPVTHKDQNDVTVDVKIVTPEGIALPNDPISLRSGIAHGSYILPEIVSYGLWKVVANFHSNPQETFAAEFEVKEHVTPSFEVELTPASTFFYIDRYALRVHIKASYSFGQNVVGTAYAVFGVMQGNYKRSFSSSVQRVPIVDGKGVVTLTREHITQTFPNIIESTGSFIFVAVSVLTESGGEMVEAELKDIKITLSPYTIHLKSSSRYFKPGMPYDVMIEVVNPDNSPAQGVAVVVDPGNVPGFTSTSGVAKVTINTAVRTETMTITVKTNDPLLRSDRQASAFMTAHSYKSKSNNVLVIYVVKTEVELGEFMEVKLLLSRQESQAKDITFLILSRGQLVKHRRYHLRGETLISQTLPITKDMLPSFRFIAYYHTNSDEVISDSVWVDVKDSCISSLKLESERPASSYKPHSTFGLKITGDPQATVGLVAVDKSTYVLNKLHLTQKKIWNTMEKYDTGCTPGGGKDSMSVFYDAGLLFETKDFGTPDRTDFKCPAFSRRKRDTTAMDVTSSLGADDNGYMDSNEIIFRTRFNKSWLWMDTVLGSCPQGNSACASTSLVKNVHLPETVTTWLFTGISLSPTHGICVSDPLEVKTHKNFFIDLRLPYSAVRGEQLEIKVIVHNYSPDPITVRVQLREEASLCSAAYRHGWHHQIVSLGAQTTLSVLFIIIPMKEGYFPVHVNAAVKDSTLNDGIKKMLRVVMGSLYYAQPKENESDCQKFDVSVKFSPDKKIDEYKLQIKVLYKDKQQDATMSILDISLLTGFTVDKNDLDILSKGRAKIIATYEMNKVLSERGSLIIYLDKVSHTRPEEISFKMQQTMKVGVLQPATVSVYEYYDRTPCVKFYHPQREAGKLLQLCRGDECTCTEEDCSMQKKGKISNDERTAKICESTEISKIDYAYKVLVENVVFEGPTDTYGVRVVDVVKEGNADVGPLNKLRAFLSYKHCRESLALGKDKNYLVMGSSKDINVDGQKQTYQYVLGERTWIEYWPSPTECQTDKFRTICLGLEKMVNHTIFACQQ